MGGGVLGLCMIFLSPQMDENKVKIVEDMQPSGSNLPYMKIEDTQYFSKLLVCLCACG